VLSIEDGNNPFYDEKMKGSDGDMSGLDISMNLLKENINHHIINFTFKVVGLFFLQESIDSMELQYEFNIYKLRSIDLLLYFNNDLVDSFYVFVNKDMQIDEDKLQL
jgi:hypothetical protein